MIKINIENALYQKCAKNIDIFWRVLTYGKNQGGGRGIRRDRAETGGRRRTAGRYGTRRGRGHRADDIGTCAQIQGYAV